MAPWAAGVTCAVPAHADGAVDQSGLISALRFGVDLSPVWAVEVSAAHLPFDASTETNDGLDFAARVRWTVVAARRDRPHDEGAPRRAPGPGDRLRRRHRPAAYNERLSRQRAWTVRQALVARGEAAPRASNETAPGRAQSRRVEFTIVDRDPEATCTPGR